jgi:hypothetical protein
MNGRPVTRGRFLIVVLEEPLDLAEEAFFVFWVQEVMAWVERFNLFINEENCFLFLEIQSDLWKFRVICEKSRVIYGNLE